MLKVDYQNGYRTYPVLFTKFKVRGKFGKQKFLENLNLQACPEFNTCKKVATRESEVIISRLFLNPTLLLEIRVA